MFSICMPFMSAFQVGLLNRPHLPSAWSNALIRAQHWRSARGLFESVNNLDKLAIRPYIRLSGLRDEYYQ